MRSFFSTAWNILVCVDNAATQCVVYNYFDGRIKCVRCVLWTDRFGWQYGRTDKNKMCSLEIEYGRRVKRNEINQWGDRVRHQWSLEICCVVIMAGPYQIALDFEKEKQNNVMRSRHIRAIATILKKIMIRKLSWKKNHDSKRSYGWRVNDPSSSMRCNFVWPPKSLRYLNYLRASMKLRWPK